MLAGYGYCPLNTKSMFRIKIVLWDKNYSIFVGAKKKWICLERRVEYIMSVKQWTSARINFFGLKGLCIFFETSTHVHHQKRWPIFNWLLQCSIHSNCSVGWCPQKHPANKVNVKASLVERGEGDGHHRVNSRLIWLVLRYLHVIKKVTHVLNLFNYALVIAIEKIR